MKLFVSVVLIRCSNHSEQFWKYFVLVCISKISVACKKNERVRQHQMAVNRQLLPDLACQWRPLVWLQSGTGL
jgi:hypothetical protein